MSIGGVLLAFAFVVAVGALVAWPLLWPRTRRAGAPDRDPGLDMSPLQAQREAILISLRDLDFDYQTGKLTEADYRLQRQTLMDRGAAVLREIDLAQGSPT
jgi:hypothetical protein